MHNRFGLRVPAHRTGCGRAALAWLDFEDVAARVLELESARVVPRPPDMDQLRKELATIRARGYALSTTSQDGRLSVAAAVLDRAGAPVGGVSLAGPFGSFNRPRLATAADEVMLAAARISRRLAKHK
jgi:DNA-binding IclR family transcriptional regulator